MCLYSPFSSDRQCIFLLCFCQLSANTISFRFEYFRCSKVNTLYPITFDYVVTSSYIYKAHDEYVITFRRDV